MTTTTENIEAFERACESMIVAMVSLHVATMLAGFQTRLIQDIVAAVDRGDFRLADVIGYVPGAGVIKDGMTLRAEWEA